MPSESPPSDPPTTSTPGRGRPVRGREERPDEAVVANRLARDARGHGAAADPARHRGGGAVDLDRQLDVDVLDGAE